MRLISMSQIVHLIYWTVGQEQSVSVCQQVPAAVILKSATRILGLVWNCSTRPCLSIDCHITSCYIMQGCVMWWVVNVMNLNNMFASQYHIKNVATWHDAIRRGVQLKMMTWGCIYANNWQAQHSAARLRTNISILSCRHAKEEWPLPSVPPSIRMNEVPLSSRYVSIASRTFKWWANIKSWRVKAGRHYGD